MNSLTHLYTELEPYVIRLTYSEEQRAELKLSLEDTQNDLQGKIDKVVAQLEALGITRESARNNITRIVEAIQNYNNHQDNK